MGQYWEKEISENAEMQLKKMQKVNNILQETLQFPIVLTTFDRNATKSVHYWKCKVVNSVYCFKSTNTAIMLPQAIGPVAKAA